MLKYHSLTRTERDMVDKEIHSNFNESARERKEFNRILENVHNGTYCCNCFRSEARCCCDKIEDCFDELDDFTGE